MGFIQSLYAALLAATVALPVAARPVRVDHEVTWTERVWLHHGFYVSAPLSEPPVVIALSFDNTVMEPLDVSPSSRSHQLGVSGSTQWGPGSAPPPTGRYESVTRIVQNWSGPQLVTSLTHSRSWLAEGEDQGWASSVTASFHSPWQEPPALTADAVLEMLTAQLDRPLPASAYEYRSWGSQDGILQWDEAVYGTVRIVGVQAIPEPRTTWLWGAGLWVLAWQGRRSVHRRGAAV